MSSATITRSGAIQGMKDGGSLSLQAPAFNIATPILGRIDPLNLSSGDNTVVVPTGATMAWFTPPANNAVTISLGDAADTGKTALDPANPQVLLLKSTVTGLHLTTGGAISGCSIQFA